MAKGGCRYCGQRTTNPRLCRDCRLEKRHDGSVPETAYRRAPAEARDGRSVGSWVRVDGMWHASVTFGSYQHEFACRQAFDDFPVERASLDRYDIDIETLCYDCRAALDPESIPIEWQRDGAFAPTATLQPDGSWQGERR